MARIVRNSKVRHLYVDAAKTESQFLGLRPSRAQGDQNYIKANEKFFAFAVSNGGGALTVQPIDKPGKLNPSLRVLDGHVGAILDFDFDPFCSNTIATGGDDCTVKVWKIPDGGLTENIVEPEVDMVEHEKKITIVRYHPTAKGVLATGSADSTVKIWDAQTGECKATFTAGTQIVQDVVWNYDGSLLAVSLKDKQLHIVDPRTGESLQSVQAHDGSKTSKLVFLGKSNRLCSVGFTKTSKRQFKIWDPLSLDSGHIAMCDMGQGTGVLMPFYDEDLGILYLAGKGDCSIRYYELTEESPYFYFIDETRFGNPTRGMTTLPRRLCNTARCEVLKGLKIAADSIEPFSVIVPRKSERFQPDLYPPAYAGEAVLSAEEFFAGQIRQPALVSMDPAKKKETIKSAETPKSVVKTPAPKPVPNGKSSDELEKEIEQLRVYVKQLQVCLEEHEIEYPKEVTQI